MSSTITENPTQASPDLGSAQIERQDGPQANLVLDNSAINTQNKSSETKSRNESAPIHSHSSVPPEVKKRAEQLLKLPESEVKIPSTVFFGLRKPLFGTGQTTSSVENIKQSFLDRRRNLLKAIVEGKKIVLSTDLDGTIAYKNPVKVNNTRSLASVNDMHWLRLLVQGLSRAGGVLEINTARPGFLSGPSIVSPEGDGGFRVAEEISGVLEEFGVFDLNDPENQKILKSLVINGLNAGVTHRPKEPLKIKRKVTQYIEFVDFLNSIKIPTAPDGFLGSLETQCANLDEKLPQRIFEYKAIPRYFLDQKDGYFSDYVHYISLVQKCRTDNWTSAKFIEEIQKANIKIPDQYKSLLNPQDPHAEEKLTAVIRDAVVACVTLHAIDADNVQRLDVKAKYYQTIIDLCRSPEAQEWAFKKYGIPKGTDLITINGKSIDHIKEFNIDNVETMLDDLKQNGKVPAKDDHILIDIKDNGQPYIEVSPNSKKKQAVTGYNDVVNTTEFTIGAGDSPSTDAALLAQAIINGGLAFKVRGLLDMDDIMHKMVELLAEERNNKHPYALIKVSDKEYKRIATGETKSREAWTEELTKQFSNKVLSAEHIHLNNALNALIFSELFPDLKFKANPQAPWFSEVHKNSNKRTLLTPTVSLLEKALDDKTKFPKFKKTLYEQLPEFFKELPIVNKALKFILGIENSPVIFNALLGIVSNALMGVGVIGAIAKYYSYEKLAKAAKLAERFAFGLNNIASGFGRGLRQSIVFPNQFWGEMLGLVSSFFPLSSVMGQTFRSLSNIVLIGRANEVIMRENYNLDSFVKDEQVSKEVDAAFGAQKKEFANIRTPAARLTKTRMDTARRLNKSWIGKIPIIGNLIALTLADFQQSWQMLKEFISIPALRKYGFANFFRPSGIPKVSKNSGKVYQNVHSPAHLYNFVGVLTLFTGVMSTLLGTITGNKTVDRVLTNLANFIPGFGVVAAARLLEQDAAGDPRQFTSVKRKESKFAPEKAGFWQKIGGWGMSLASPFLGSDIGQLLFNAATGAYLKGIQYELPIRLDDSAINERRRTGKGFTQDKFGQMGKDATLDFAKKFHQALASAKSPEPSN